MLGNPYSVKTLKSEWERDSKLLDALKENLNAQNPPNKPQILDILHSKFPEKFPPDQSLDGPAVNAIPNLITQRCFAQALTKLRPLSQDRDDALTHIIQASTELNGMTIDVIAFAAQHGQNEIVQILFDAYKNKPASQDDLNNLFYSAIKGENLDLIKYLYDRIEPKIDLNIAVGTNDTQGSSANIRPLFYVTHYSDHENFTSVFDWMIQNGAKLLERNDNERSILSYALETPNIENFTYILTKIKEVQDKEDQPELNLKKELKSALNFIEIDNENDTSPELQNRRIRKAINRLIRLWVNNGFNIEEIAEDLIAKELMLAQRSRIQGKPVIFSNIKYILNELLKVSLKPKLKRTRGSFDITPILFYAIIESDHDLINFLQHKRTHLGCYTAYEDLLSWVEKELGKTDPLNQQKFRTSIYYMISRAAGILKKNLVTAVINHINNPTESHLEGSDRRRVRESKLFSSINIEDIDLSAGNIDIAIRCAQAKPLSSQDDMYEIEILWKNHDDNVRQEITRQLNENHITDGLSAFCNQFSSRVVTALENTDNPNVNDLWKYQKIYSQYLLITGRGAIIQQLLKKQLEIQRKNTRSTEGPAAGGGASGPGSSGHNSENGNGSGPYTPQRPPGRPTGRYFNSGATGASSSGSQARDIGATLRSHAKTNSYDAIDNMITASGDTLDINAVDASGNTALHIAASKNHFEAIKSIYNHGNVNPDIKNKAGKTALDIAMQKKHPNIAIIKFLMEKSDEEVNMETVNKRHIVAKAIQAGEYLLALTLIQNPAFIADKKVSDAIHAAETKHPDNPALIDLGCEHSLRMAQKVLISCKESFSSLQHKLSNTKQPSTEKSNSTTRSKGFIGALTSLFTREKSAEFADDDDEAIERVSENDESVAIIALEQKKGSLEDTPPSLEQLKNLIKIHDPADFSNLTKHGSTHFSKAGKHLKTAKEFYNRKNTTHGQERL